MKITEIVEQRSRPAAGRAAYVPPVLKVFGPVGALTQSGTGTMVESSQQMGARCQNRIDRQRC